MTRYQIRHILEAVAFLAIILAGLGAVVAFAHLTHGVPEKIADFILRGGRF